MLSLQKQQKFIKKTIQLPNGAWAYVVFELVEVNGKMVAKAISAKLIEENIISEQEILALPVFFERQTFKPIVSPFFSNTIQLLKDLSFVVSQPTRAPSLF
jgi:hypothetical protein